MEKPQYIDWIVEETGIVIKDKTDHDRGRRATSAGPYTSRIMTECLEKEVKNRNIPIYNGYQAIKILVSEKRV